MEEQEDEIKKLNEVNWITIFINESLHKVVVNNEFEQPQKKKFLYDNSTS
jgi:hypothetical protein